MNPCKHGPGYNFKPISLVGLARFQGNKGNSRSFSITDTVISNCIVSSSSQQQSKEWSSSWQQMQSGRRCLSHHFGGIHINLQLVTQAIHLHKRCFIATDPLTRCRRLNCILPLGMLYDKCSSGKYQYVIVCVWSSDHLTTCTVVIHNTSGHRVATMIWHVWRQKIRSIQVELGPISLIW
jgi:hypothetical protein